MKKKVGPGPQWDLKDFDFDIQTGEEKKNGIDQRSRRAENQAE